MRQVVISIAVKPLLLDLFCGAGGASKGYMDAGFEVIGIDINPMPRYIEPHDFGCQDAIGLLEHLIDNPEHLDRFCAIHASPPCQHYSKTKFMNPDRIGTHPDLIGTVRGLLVKTGKPYIIENVKGAPLIDPVELCGSHFNLNTVWEPHGKVGLRRHRLFETNFPVPDPGKHDHSLRAVPVYGHGSGNSKTRLKGKGLAKAQREVMGIDWMRREELDQAIPPAFTRYIGQYLMEYLNDQ